MYQIKNSVWLDIKLGDAVYPIADLGFKSVTLIENNRLLVPTATVILADGMNWFENNAKLVDGLPISISVGTSETTVKTYNFRLFRYQRELFNATITYTLECYLDVPKYLFDSVPDGVRGTSAEALSYIAGLSGLRTSLDSTADTQYWRCGSRRLASWATDIAKHGYASGSSLMQLCVTLEGTLLYKNVNSSAALASEPVLKVGRGLIPDTIEMLDARSLNTSGMQNSFGGYKLRLVEQPRTAVQTEWEQCTVQSMGTLDRNSDIVDEIREGRVLFGPIDCGNTHANYYRAAHQNERGALLWSTGYEVLIASPHAATLLDLAQLTDFSVGHDIEESRFGSGLYLITAHAIHINGSNYYEKFGMWTTSTSQRRGSQ